MDENDVIHGMKIELDAEESISYAVSSLTDALLDALTLFKESMRHKVETRYGEKTFTTDIEIQCDEKSIFLEYVRKIFNKKTNPHEFTVPEFILKSDNGDLIRPFLRGYADVASLISSGTRVFGIGKYRIYVNVYGGNLTLMDQLIFLLLKTGVRCGRHDRKGTRDHDAREMQIRVYPEDFTRVGFNFSWKKKLLYDFIRANRELKQIEDSNQESLLS